MTEQQPSRRAFLGALASSLALPSLLRRRSTAPSPALSLPPLIARPTMNSVLVHARNGEVETIATLEVLKGGSRSVEQSLPMHAKPGDFLEWNVAGLEKGTQYQYRIKLSDSPAQPAAEGGFVTQRPGHQSYTAALITDPHTGTFPEGSTQVAVMDAVVANVVKDRPDFVIGLGDNVAWNSSRGQAQETPAGAERAYDMYRRHVGPITASAAHFSLLGNWEGESGKLPRASIDLVGGVRRRFLPNPNAQTYPEGGSAGEDYYAFTWGPALFVILNVQTYTKPSAPRPLPAVQDVSRVEDWSLGAAQLDWLERTLKSSSAPFKFLCIHHTVSGSGANDGESLYGRGGARAAHVGEQRVVHQLMRDHGVQAFFFGHDHVFVDDVVDGIHYTLPGSFGAPWHFGKEVTGYERFWTDSGHARLSVSVSETKVEFVNQAGVSFYAYTVKPV